MKIKIDELRDICVNVVKKQGLTQKNAELIVEEYIDGQLRGRECHGVSALPKFVISKINGPIKEHKILKDQDCYMLVDGNGSMGQLVLNDIFPKLIQKAKNKGIAMLGIYNMHSYMMPGTYARLATKSDLIAHIYNYGGAPRIAPYGSIDPVFATNPIAVGIPSNNFPIVIDMATSKTAMGKVRLAKKLCCNIADNVAIDNEGHVTVYPDKAMHGALFFFGGYKGSAMALMVEVMSRSMFNIPLDNEIKGKRGFFFILIDPSVFTDINLFKQNVSDLINKIKNSRKADGIDEIFLPGEHSEKIKQENLMKGEIEVDDKIIEEIKGLL